MSNSSKPTISVIIPVHNGGDTFRQCIAALSKTKTQPLEIIVVVDGDTDNSWKTAERLGANIIKISPTSGPAKARNAGAAIAKGEVLFFVDADVSIQSSTIGEVATYFEREPTLSAIIGSYDDQPGAKNFLSQYKNLFHHYIHQVSCEEASTFWGACGAIRREVFLAVGGFDERYHYPSVEDIELGYRLKAAGYNIRLYKSLQVKHLKHWGPISLLRAELFYRALPWLELILRDRKIQNDLNLRWRDRLSVILVYGLLGTLLGTVFSTICLYIASVLFMSILILNIDIYYFFYRKRGMLFSILALPWHLFYYCYCGLAVVIALSRYWWREHLSSTLSNVAPLQHK